MSWALIIEEDQGLAQAINDALLAVEPKVTPLYFPDSHAFLKWMDQVQAQDPKLEPKVPADKFLGIVTSVESWKFRDVKLIGKFKALFIQKGFAKTEDEIFVVFTAYETPGFQKHRFENRSVTNLIFKPFDKLVLHQLLESALTGRQATKNHQTHILKKQSEIEMLKEIRMSEISEIGFKTRSNQELVAGSTAKYFSDFLETKQHRSALAQILNCAPSTEAGLWDIELRFFALDQAQSFNIQKLAQVEKKHRVLASPEIETDPSAYEFYLFKKEGSPLASELAPSLERFFDHPVVMIEDLAELHAILAAKKENLKHRFVFIDHAHIAGNEKAELEVLHGLHANEKLSLFPLCPRILPEALEIELTAVAEDIFYAPFNKSYIVKTLKKRWPRLKNKEEIFELHQECDQLSHVSNPVKAIETSETEVVIEYHRPIHLGSFREFHLPMANELEVPTIVAQCNFTKPTDNKAIFHCHFIFFGMRDLELKFIRRWMLLQYVDAKQKEASN